MFFFSGGGRFGEAARVSELFLVRGRGCWDRGLYLVNIFYKEFKSKKKKLGGGGGAGAGISEYFLQKFQI